MKPTLTGLYLQNQKLSAAVRTQRVYITDKLSNHYISLQKQISSLKRTNGVSFYLFSFSHRV